MQYELGLPESLCSIDHETPRRRLVFVLQCGSRSSGEVSPHAGTDTADALGTQKPQPTWYVKPVLAFVRPDGTTGRLQPYRDDASILTPPPTARRLFQLIECMPGRRVALRELFASWRLAEQLASPNACELEPPVELYVERADGLQPERPARLFPLRALHVSWRAAEIRDGRPILKPMITPIGPGSQPGPTFSAPADVEATSFSLVVVDRAGGGVWCRGGNACELEPACALARSAAPYTIEEATELRKQADRSGGLLTVAPLPKQLAALRRSPVAVVHLETEEDRSVLALTFRYGTDELHPTDRREQWITRDDGGESPAAVGARGDQALPEGGTVRVAFRDRAGETELTGTILATLAGALPPSLRGYYNAAGARALLPRLAAGIRIDRDALDLVSEIGPELLERGIEIRISGEPVRLSSGGAGYRVASGGEDWLELEAGIAEGNGFVALEEPLSRGRLARTRGAFVVLREPVAFDEAFQDRLRARFGRTDLGALEPLSDQLVNPDHRALDRVRRLKRSFAELEDRAGIAPPASFRGSLRPYQQAGLSWLWFLHRNALGGILADDMGLGKTIQTLALLDAVRVRDGLERVLVVCPVSTMHNWRAEAEAFIPHLSVYLHTGPQRTGSDDPFGDATLVLVSYQTLLRDRTLFAGLELDYLILDEAQNVKNAGSRTHRAVAALTADHRIALTGTPVENGTLELWAIMQLVFPGLLGTRAEFTRRYANPIERRGDAEAAEHLRTLVRPLILRRTKLDVAPDLPARNEEIVYAELDETQRSLYESLRRKFRRQVRQEVEHKGVAGAGIKIMEAMLRLRQAAILPALVDPEHASVPAAKIDLLLDMLAEIRAEGHKALVFSQFVGVLEPLSRQLAEEGHESLFLHGGISSSARAEAIRRFQEGNGASVFLVSLKAGGVGINLTAADYVLLLDPWWNPAAEAQAVDRAHRIGRRHPVFAYRFIARDTIEERIVRLQERKRELYRSLIGNDGSALRNLSASDVMGLFD